MSAEVKNISQQVLEEVVVKPGEITPPLKTPAGTIQIIGLERGFAIRRPNSTEFDLRYENGESLTFYFKDGRITKVSAASPQDWQASDMLDPME